MEVEKRKTLLWGENKERSLRESNVTSQSWNQTRLSCSSLKSQCLRDKGWWGKKEKDASFKKPATWEDGGLASVKPLPHC